MEYLERIGDYGHIWATHYATGWSVFAEPSAKVPEDNWGLIRSGLTRREAADLIMKLRTMAGDV